MAGRTDAIKEALSKLARVGSVKEGYKVGKRARSASKLGDAFAGPLQGNPGGLLGTMGYQAGAHPGQAALLAGLLGVPAASWGLDRGQDLFESVTGNEEAKRRKLMIMQMLAESDQVNQDDELNSLIDQNSMLLSQKDPHMAAQLMAGRRLPPGAAMFGGQPREDLLREVAAAMAQGRV